MFGWLKSLFGAMDRQTAAADRAAKALEDIADDLESVRDQMRARLGIEGAAPKPLVAVKESEEPEPAAKGKRAK